MEDPFARCPRAAGFFETAYVVNTGDASVTPIEVANNEPREPIPVGVNPVGIAIAPNGKTAYVTNGSSASVTPIELANNKPEEEIPVGTEPAAVAITPASATCTTNTGTVTLSPGLTNTAATQTLKIKGALTECSGESFTGTTYTATLKTAGMVGCPVLKTAGELASGAAKFKWTPKTKPATSTGTLEMLLTETPSVALSGELTAGPFSPLMLSGKTSMTFTGGSTCATKAVKKGTFTGTTVVLN